MYCLQLFRNWAPAKQISFKVAIKEKRKIYELSLLQIMVRVIFNL